VLAKCVSVRRSGNRSATCEACYSHVCLCHIRGVESILPMKNIDNNQIVIYQGPGGSLELKADTGKETIWANLNQIAALFDTDKSGISRHINNILKTGELTDSTVANFATVQNEGSRAISRQIEYYRR